MAQLIYPIVQAGLVVDILVNLQASALIPLRASGGGPSPIKGHGLLDTGSDITAVALPILQQLGLSPIAQGKTHGISASVQVDLYHVSLHIFDPQNLRLPWLSQPSLLVMELAPHIPFDVLVGMDILRTCNTLIHGPAAHFTLEF